MAAKLRPWLAIAAAVDADLPELQLAGNELWPDAGKPVTLRLYPHEICPAAEWREALALARDAALNALKQQSGSANENALKQQSGSANENTARDLIMLAGALRIRSWKP